MEGKETIEWQDASSKPDSDEPVLILLSTGVVDAGLWWKEEKCWFFGTREELYIDEETEEFKVLCWAKMPTGPST